MTNILIILILSTFWCYGVRALFLEGKLFENVGIFMDANFPLWINQPLWRCPPCMASVHGLFIYATFMMPFHEWFWALPFIVMLCGLNYILTWFMNE